MGVQSGISLVIDSHHTDLKFGSGQHAECSGGNRGQAHGVGAINLRLRNRLGVLDLVPDQGVELIRGSHLSEPFVLGVADLSVELYSITKFVREALHSLERAQIIRSACNNLNGNRHLTQVQECSLLIFFAEIVNEFLETLSDYDLIVMLKLLNSTGFSFKGLCESTSNCAIVGHEISSRCLANIANIIWPVRLPEDTVNILSFKDREDLAVVIHLVLGRGTIDGRSQ